MCNSAQISAFKMALDLNKDPYTYAKDYEGFIHDLKLFHTNRGSPFVKIPQLAGKDIDLYLLYRRVIALGGWQKVNDELRWDEIQEEFRVPRGCTNGATALKQIYIRYLDLYEKVHFLGEDPKYERMEYDDQTAARKKSTSVIHGVPLYYNNSQHHTSKYVRENAGFSCDLVEISDYHKLEKSFLCGLPNEVDFAMNVCLLLSNEGKHVLKLAKSSHLLELMLAQVAIFKEGPGSLAKIYEDGWKVTAKRDFVKFWYDTVLDDKLRTLILPTDSPYTPKERPGQDVLNLGREIGINDVEGQRILQMAVIFRNLSFEMENCKIMASNSLVFRFLMLCSHSKFGCLKQIGLDTVGNIASQFVLSAAVDDSVNILLGTVCRCLVSPDKFEVVRGLEILSKLSQVEKNEDILAEKLQRKSFEDIVQLLTIHDIQLIVYTLEALYQLSELGEVATTHIASVKNAVDVLVSLITVEAQSYGPSSLVGIKVVEYVPPPQAPEALPGSSGPPSMGKPAPPSAPVTPRAAARQLHAKATTPLQNQPIPADSESFACNWLRSNYEYKEEGQLSQVSMYSEYLSFCGRIPIKDVVASAAFIDCIRAVFSQADQITVERAGNKDVHVRGVSKRALPLPVAIPAPVVSSCNQYTPRRGQKAAANKSRVLTMNSPLRQRLSAPPKHQLHHRSPYVFYAGIGQYQNTPKGAEGPHSKANVTCSSQGMAQPPSNPSPSLHIAQGQQQMSSPTPSLPGSPFHTPQQSPNRPMTILQQQLQTPPQNSPAFKKAKRQKSSKFPSIKNALHSAVSPQSKHNGSHNQYSDTDSSLGSTPKKQTDSNMIKTLLAKKLNQNMIRHNAAAAAAAMQTGDQPSSPVSGPPVQQQQQQQSLQHQQAQPSYPTNPSLSQPSCQMPIQPVLHQSHNQTAPSQPQPVYSHQEQYGVGSAAHQGAIVIPMVTESQPAAPSPNPAVSNPTDFQPLENRICDSSQQQLQEKLVQQQEQLTNNITQADHIISTNHDSLVNEDQTPPGSPPPFPESPIISKAPSPKQLPSEELRPNSPRSLSPHSLRSYHLDVCGEVECAKDIVQQANETKIECIENKVLNEQEHISELVCDSRAHLSRPSEAPSPVHDSSSREAPCADSTLSISPPKQDGGAEPRFESNGPVAACTDSVVCPGVVSSPTDRLPFNRPEEVEIKVIPSYGLSMVNGCYDDSSKDSDASFQQCEEKIPPLPEEDVKSVETDDPVDKLVGKLVNGIENDAEIEKMKKQIADATTLKEEISKQSPTLEKAAKLLQSKNGVVNHYGNGDYFSANIHESSNEITSLRTGCEKKLNVNAEASFTQEGEATIARVPVNGSVINGDMNYDEDSLGSVSNQSAPILPHSEEQKPLVEDMSMEMEVTSPCIHNKPNNLDCTDNSTPSAMEVESSEAEQTLKSEPVTKPVCQSDFSLSSTTAAAARTDSVTNSVNGSKSPMDATSSASSSTTTTPAKVKKKHSISKPGSAEKGGAKKSKSTEKDKKPKSRKRSRSNTSTGESQCSSMASSTGAELACEWNGCKRMFEMPKSVFSHAYSAHMCNSVEEVCKWEGCDKLQRKKWSLITHLQDHHCSEQALKQAAQRRQQAAGQLGSSVAQQPANGQQAPAALIYPPDAAIQAIRRFSARPPFQELVEPREGPVTKHIRLTAALVLRNLARYSAVGRSLIKKHERQISYSALSAVESSSALANCLWAALHDH